METKTIKDQAVDIIDHLPQESTWDDVMYSIYVRQSIDAGIADGKAGRMKDVSEVRQMFGLPKA